jgi:hypothetical protein
VSVRDSIYVSTLAREVVPHLEDLLGTPTYLDTLLFAIGDEDAYWWGPMGVTMRPIVLDHDSLTGGTFPNSNQWDNTFVHEMSHAFQRGRMIGDPYWLGEGIAEATRYFVARSMVESGSTRRIMDPRTPLHMALADMYDRGERFLSGGIWWYPHHANGEACYRGAAAAIIIPCLAELAAGRNLPHPLRRFANNLAHESENILNASWEQAADSAWVTPIDGVSPPSRWLRSRSVEWTQRFRDGAHLSVLTEPPSTPVNPTRLQLFAFDIWFSLNFDRRILPGRLTFTDVRGGRWETVSESAVSAVPALPPGAYLVDAKAETEWPATPIVRGRNWIVVTSSGQPVLDSGSGTALIFADSTGRPVDPPDVTVNGRIIDRVPGAVVVAPYAASPYGEMLTVRSGDRVLGSVTVAGPFSRTVVMNVDEDAMLPSRPIAWRPYRPARGDTLTVWLRRLETELDPGDSEVGACLRIPGGPRTDWHPMTRLPGSSDVWIGKVPVPADAKTTSLIVGNPWHNVGNVDGLAREEVRPLAGTTCPISGVDWDLAGLVLSLDGELDGQALGLQASASSGGSDWVSLPVQVAAMPGGRVHLSFDLARAGKRVRIVIRSGSNMRVMVTLNTPQSPGRTELTAGSPFPNPLHGAISWPIDVSTPVMATMGVYDLSGRLVAGPFTSRLQQGPQTVSWERPSVLSLSAGVYFLRLSAGGRDVIRKVVKMPRQGE